MITIIIINIIIIFVIIIIIIVIIIIIIIIIVITITLIMDSGQMCSLGGYAITLTLMLSYAAISSLSVE